MHSFNNKTCSTLLDHLAQDKNFRIKNSQSAQYFQSNSVQIDRLYDHIRNKMRQNKIFIGNQDQSIEYNTQSKFGKIGYIKMVVDYFIDKNINIALNKAKNEDDENQIQCDDCKNYQTYLQKLQNDIRQHIRLQQQLKLYQEGLQQKIQQQKKDNQKLVQKISQMKKSMDDNKTKEYSFTQKINKLEEQCEKLRQDGIKNKSGLLSEHTTHRLTRDQSQGKSFKVLHDLKQNTIAPLKNTNKKDEKKECRKSCQKRPQSSERWRQNSHTNIHTKKNFPLTQKLIMEKNKQEKRKTLQTKFEMRR